MSTIPVTFTIPDAYLPYYEARAEFFVILDSFDKLTDTDSTSFYPVGTIGSLSRLVHQLKVMQMAVTSIRRIISDASQADIDPTPERSAQLVPLGHTLLASAIVAEYSALQRGIGLIEQRLFLPNSAPTAG